MAKSPPAHEDAPVLDQAVEATDGDEAAPKKRFALKLKLPKIPLPKIPLPRIAISKKLLIIVIGSVVAVSTAGAAAYMFWPKDPEYPRTPVKRSKAKKPKKAASAPEAAASAASAADPALAAASAPVEAASGPEVPLDRLQRRLGEVLGAGATIKPDGAGELRLTAKPGSAPVASHRSDPAAPGRERAHAGPKGADADAGAGQDTQGGPKVRAARSATALAGHAHWSYEGNTGPDAWSRLKPEFAKCGTGMRQSPIDIRDGIAVDLDPIRFHYKPSAFGVIDNGHTVQVKVAPGNFIEVLGRRYELQQFHFHRPSEARIDGRVFDMDVQLVHKDGEGRLAVVAVLLERGSAQPVVQSVWNNLPLEKGEEQMAMVDIDPAQLIPPERGYYTYMGSLTTPPCSEGVLWMVMKKPVQVSPEQIGIFSRMYPMNARPVQSAAGRMIKESN